MESAYSKKEEFEVDKIFSIIVVEIPPTVPTRDLNPIFFDSTAFCAELLAHPLDIVIPYCPLDGKCLFSKITKIRQFQKNVDPHHVVQ